MRSLCGPCVAPRCSLGVPTWSLRVSMRVPCAHALCVFPVCSLCFPCVFPVCSLCVPCVLGAPIDCCLFSACSLCVPCVCPLCMCCVCVLCACFWGVAVVVV